MLVSQLCPTICNLMVCSLPGFSGQGVLQARKLEWVAIPFSRAWSNLDLPHCRQILYHLSHQESACDVGDPVPSLGWEDPLEKGMATHSSFLAWRIPWTEDPGGLQSMGSQRGGHDWATKHSTAHRVDQWRDLYRQNGRGPEGVLLSQRVWVGNSAQPFVSCVATWVLLNLSLCLSLLEWKIHSNCSIVSEHFYEFLTVITN